MAGKSQENAIRALVEGGLRMINNLIPDAPTPRQIQQTIQIAPVAQPSRQLRLNLTQPGRGAQSYSPVKSSTESAAEVIRSKSQALPAETTAQRNARLLQEAREANLLITPTRSLRTGGQLPEFADYVFERARTPRTVRTQAAAGPAEYTSPEPAFAYGKELMRRDPEGYSRIRAIVETTAAERGVNADAVMEALLSPEGVQSPLVRQLETTPSQFLTRGGELVPSNGGSMVPPSSSASTALRGPGGALATTPSSSIRSAVEPVNVYEVSRAQQALPEGNAMQMFSDALGGVNMVDLRQALANPEFMRSMGRSLEQLANTPAVAAAAEGGAEAARRISFGPVVGAGMLGGLGVGAYLRGRPGAQEFVDAMGAPGETALGAPTATLEGANLPAVTGDPSITVPPQSLDAAGNAIPGTVNPGSLISPAATITPAATAPIGGTPPAMVASAMGGGSVPQLMDSKESEYRQAVQRAAQGLRQDASQYKNIGDFYRVQSAYANAPGRAEEILGALKGMGAPTAVGIETESELDTWARRNPALAYQLQLKMQRRADSQQMPTQQGVVLGTSLGNNNMNNMQGQARAAAINAAFGTQGASDLNATLVPQAYQTIEKAPLF